MVYLDYAATSPLKYPSSKYDAWLNANTPYAISSRKSLTYAEELVKKTLGVKSGKVMFGGCASEMVRRLYFENAYAAYWIGSSYEHDCIHTLCDRYNEVNTVEGIRLVSGWGDLPILYAHQLVNNVNGAIFDIKRYGDWAKESDNHIFLCDLTASIGKVMLPDFEELGVDIALWSGHKLGTEKNIGCAWFSDKALKWLGEDFKLQLGTPNVEGAMAVAEASWNAVKSIKEKEHHWSKLLWKLLRSLADNGIENKWMADYDTVYTPAINAITLPNINADALQQYLASKEIYVGLGASACAANHDYRVLEAFGVSKEEVEHTIRVSFGEDSSLEDVEALVEGIKKFKEMFV